jgi:hypothetical protein
MHDIAGIGSAPLVAAAVRENSFPANAARLIKRGELDSVRIAAICKICCALWKLARVRTFILIIRDYQSIDEAASRNIRIDSAKPLLCQNRCRAIGQDDVFTRSFHLRWQRTRPWWRKSPGIKTLPQVEVTALAYRLSQ